MKKSPLFCPLVDDKNRMTMPKITLTSGGDTGLQDADDLTIIEASVKKQKRLAGTKIIFLFGAALITVFVLLFHKMKGWQ